MVRHFKKNRYIVAGIITMSIFLLGLMLGLVIEAKRIQYVEFHNRMEKLDYSSLQLQYAYIDYLRQEENCPAMSKALQDSIIQLEMTRIRLENYEREATIVNRNEFDLLKREYIIAQLNYVILAERTKKMCDLDMINVLYFYSTKRECPKCEDQAFVLTFLKNELRERLLIFALDSNYEKEPMIGMLKSQYEISEFPTLVVDGEPYPGFSSKDDLLGIICPIYKEKPEICNGYY